MKGQWLGDKIHMIQTKISKQWTENKISRGQGRQVYFEARERQRPGRAVDVAK